MRKGEGAQRRISVKREDASTDQENEIAVNTSAGSKKEKGTRRLAH